MPEPLLNLPYRDFLERVAARTPSPGGGSVAAATGLLSAALARMVLEYTITRKGNADHEPRLRAALEELKRASSLFAQLLEEDVAAYERYVASRQSVDPVEQQRSVATAIAVPLETAAVAEAVAERMNEVKEWVSPALYSDVQVSTILAHATAESAGWTVTGNLAHLKDAQEAAALADRLHAILAHSQQHRDAVLAYRPA